MASSQLMKPDLNDTIAILSELWNTNAAIPNNEHTLEKIHTHIKTQLPQIINNYHTVHADRETRKKSLELISEEFTETFLNKTKYFYSTHSELYFTYNNQVRYSLINEDEIHHQILTEITNTGSMSNANNGNNVTNASVMTWKYKIKNRIIKSIQERDILKSIPESRTIQNIISYLCPALFRTRDHAKYFLTLLGDVLLKKSTPLIYFIPPAAKEFIKDLGAESYGLFGSNTFATAFKFKYYDHNYKDCRVVDCYTPVDGGGLHHGRKSCFRLSHSTELKASIIDLFCVAAHYSHRFGSADEFLSNHCKTQEVANHAWFFRTRTEPQILEEFMNYATEPSSSENGITMPNMLYLWKMYLDEFRLPSMFFAATLRVKLTEYVAGGATATSVISPVLDVIPNRTSRYLPVVSKFMRFWVDKCIVNDTEIELEIDELSTLFNDDLSESVITTDATLLGIIRHFYPDVLIEDDKYILNVGCHMWNKKSEINEYLEEFKIQCVTQNLSFPQPLYNAYEYYCGKCYATAKRRIASKRYFEKFFMEEYASYLDENGMITMGWWLD